MTTFDVTGFRPTREPQAAAAAALAQPWASDGSRPRSGGGAP